MAWYAYCITEQQTLTNGTRSRRPSLLEGVQGVNGATVLVYPSGEFNIVVSEYERDGEQFGEKNVLEHARAVLERRTRGAHIVHEDGHRSADRPRPPRHA